jgi:hypothetical protein
VCTFTLGAPFNRQFACRATLGQAEADARGLLFLTVRDGAQSAIGYFQLPRAASGHYSEMDGSVNMWTLPGFESFSAFTADDSLPGTEYVADVTLDSDFDVGVSEVRGRIEGALNYGGTESPESLVPFSVEF